MLKLAESFLAKEEILPPLNLLVINFTESSFPYTGPAVIKCVFIFILLKNLSLIIFKVLIIR